MVGFIPTRVRITAFSKMFMSEELCLRFLKQGSSSSPEKDIVQAL